MKITVSNKISANIDKYFAIIGTIIAVFLILYSLIFNNNYLYTVTGVLIICTTIYWLKIRKNITEIDLSSKMNMNIIKILITSFFIIFTLSILSIYFNSQLYVRPLAYFILTSFLPVILLLEIIFSTKSFNKIILVQIISLSFLLIFSEYFLFPSVIGNDPWWHQFFASLISNSGYITSGQIYSGIPVFHVEVVSTSVLSNLNYKLAAAFSITVFHVVMNALFTYLIGKDIFNDKVGLLAALIVSIANISIFMGFSPIPNTLGPSLFLLIIYVLIKEIDIKFKILMLLLMVILVLIHTISSFIVAVALFIGFIINYFFYRSKDNPDNSNEQFTLTIALFFSVLMFAWWIYVSGSINNFLGVFKWGSNVDNFLKNPDVYKSFVKGIPPVERILSNLGTFSFFALSILGVLYMINKKIRSYKSVLIGLTGLLLLSIGFVSIFIGSFIVVDRWFYFAEVLLSIPLSLSLFLIYQHTKKKVMIVSILMFCLSFVLIISPTANVDNHILTPNSQSTMAITESELTAVQTIKSIWNGKTGSDQYYSKNLFRSNSRMLDSEIYNKNFTSSVVNNRLILVRQRMYDEPIDLYSGTYQIDYDLNALLKNSGFSEIYDVGSVECYLK